MNYLLSEKSLLSKFKGNLGEDDYKEPLTMLLDSLNSEANLSLTGKMALRYQITSHLKIRSKIFEFLDDKELKSLLRLFLLLDYHDPEQHFYLIY